MITGKSPTYSWENLGTRMILRMYSDSCQRWGGRPHRPCQVGSLASLKLRKGTVLVIYWRDCLFLSDILGSFHHKLIDRVCADLILGSMFCCIDLCVRAVLICISLKLPFPLNFHLSQQNTSSLLKEVFLLEEHIPFWIGTHFYWSIKKIFWSTLFFLTRSC